MSFIVQFEFQIWTIQVIINNLLLYFLCFPSFFQKANDLDGVSTNGKTSYASRHFWVASEHFRFEHLLILALNERNITIWDPRPAANYRLLNYRLPPRNLFGVLENIITKWACKNTKQLRRPASCYYVVAGLEAGTVLLP